MRTLPNLAPLTLGLALVAVLAWRVWAAVDDGFLQSAVTGGGGIASNGALEIVGSTAQPVTGRSASTSSSGDFELHSGVWLGDLSPIVTDVGEPGLRPDLHRLIGAVPNPFNPRTEVRFELAHATRVRIHVLDVRGRLIRALVDESRPAGMHSVVWDGSDQTGRRVASGTYFLRLDADDLVETRKVSLLK